MPIVAQFSSDQSVDHFGRSTIRRHLAAPKRLTADRTLNSGERMRAETMRLDEGLKNFAGGRPGRSRALLVPLVGGELSNDGEEHVDRVRSFYSQYGSGLIRRQPRQTSY
jgi:hypothetical protein